MNKFRQTICLVFVLFNMIILYVFYRQVSYSLREQEFFLANFVAISAGHNDVCNLPVNISAFDASILEYLKKLPSSIECSMKDERLTFIDAGRLRQQDVAGLECYYQFIRRPPHDDSSIILDPALRLDPNSGLLLDQDENYLLVTCHQKESQIYQNVHFWFGAKKLVGAKSGRKKPSIMILVLESLSRINYHRYLTQTKQVLSQKLGNIYYLDGMNKMADNSFPNMAPLLTGRLMYRGELKNEDYGPYDDWPLIWKDFASKGYTTALIEDYPRFTLFNYFSNGFVHGTPTHFYPRPFWLQLYKQYGDIMMRMFPFQISPCYRQRVPKIDIFFHQLSHFMQQTKAQHSPYFAFTFFIELTHNDFNAAQTIDSHVAKFVENNLDNLKDAIFVVMGDHGNRFGPVLQTTIGRIEERMPLFAMHLPQNFLAHHPHMHKHLKANRYRLSTWLDVHQMFQDVLKDNYTPSKPESTTFYSPWRQEIPRNRSCEEALIPELYCACDHRKQLNLSSTMIVDAGGDVLETINRELAKHTQDKCAKLTLRAILNAEVIVPSRSIATRQNYKHTIELTIKADPSDAIFRTRIFRSAHHDEWQIDLDQITRLDEYGSQSDCITRRSLKKYCFCDRPTSLDGAL